MSKTPVVGSAREAPRLEFSENFLALFFVSLESCIICTRYEYIPIIDVVWLCLSHVAKPDWEDNDFYESQNHSTTKRIFSSKENSARTLGQKSLKQNPAKQMFINSIIIIGFQNWVEGFQEAENTFFTLLNVFLSAGQSNTLWYTRLSTTTTAIVQQINTLCIYECGYCKYNATSYVCGELLRFPRTRRVLPQVRFTRRDDLYVYI